MNNHKLSNNQIETYDLYINGQWVKSASDKYLDVVNPATEEVVGRVSCATETEVELALETSTQAAKQWRELSVFDRAKYLYKLNDKLLENKEKLATLLTLEQGKTYTESLYEVDDTIDYIQSAIESAKNVTGDILPSVKSDEMIMIKKVPYGVTLALCAWNYPLALVGRKIGPALATGNTVIVKPHDLTPLATAEFFRLVDEVGFPPGVINLITSDTIEAGQQLVSSSKTKLISVTGSVRAGQAIARSASNNIAGLILELGGKAPFIVLEDADIDKAVEAAVYARYANCGQICICCDMVFVHEAVADEFTQKLLEKVRDIKVGDPFDESTTMGPKVSLGDLNKIDRIVRETVEQGASIATGGKSLKGGMFDKGYWYEPTVLVDVESHMTAAVDEIFGPVLPILRISSLKEAIEISNASPYGLAAYLFTKDYGKFVYTSEHLDVGTIFYNQGISGYTHVYHSGHKLSGLNGEDGKYGIEDFLQKLTLYMHVDQLD